MQETGHAGAVTANAYGISADEARDKISEIKLNKSHPYYDTQDPGHSKAVAKMDKLYRIVYPSE